jgi:hypothetical protein
MHSGTPPEDHHVPVLNLFLPHLDYLAGGRTAFGLRHQQNSLNLVGACILVDKATWILRRRFLSP